MKQQLFRFTSAAITTITLSNSETCVIQTIDCIILKSFNLLMTSSMWILTSDIFRDFSTSYADICDFPQVKFGIVRKAPYVANSSSMVNPLFARTCCNFSKNLLLIVSSLSDTLPTQPCERKLIAPAGVMPIKYLQLWGCLQLDQVWACAVKPKGLSINTSKQSIIETQFLKFQNDSDRFLFGASLSGHTRNISSFSDNTVIQLL